MTPTITPDTPLLDAAHMLMETNQRGLPVIDRDGALVGVISEGNFLHRTELDISAPPGNWLEELLGIEEDTPARRRMGTRLVREAMVREPVCVDDEASLDEVVALMDTQHYRAAPGCLRQHRSGHRQSLRAVGRSRKRAKLSRKSVEVV